MRLCLLVELDIPSMHEEQDPMASIPRMATEKIMTSARSIPGVEGVMVFDATNAIREGKSD